MNCYVYKILKGNTIYMKQKNKQLIWDIGKLPFHVGMSDCPHNENVPDTLDFQIGIDINTSMIIQLINEKIISELEKTYNIGSQICTSMGESKLGQWYLNDFLGFILKSLDTKSLKGLKILEIGCGKGYLLKVLSELGADVIGIDPSNAQHPYADQANVEVITNNFDKSLFTHKFDLIIHYAVLEHVFNAKSFMSDQLKLLNSGGSIIFSVPDCTEHLYYGDISMFVHEHISYLDTNILKNFADEIGADVKLCCKAGKGGAIYSVWLPSYQSSSLKRSYINSHNFVRKAKNGLLKMKNFFFNLKNSNKTLGIFCPGRFINYHYLLSDSIGKIRYFDDNDQIHGKYYPPIDIKVESRDNLQENPVDVLLIMSRSFGKEIKLSFKDNKMNNTTDIITINEIL